jgi:glycosyltransferase involved in cell wall biosynthesis
MTSDRPRVAILLGVGQDPEAWRRRHARGETLDETPYGYERAVRWFDLVWARSTEGSRPVERVGAALAGRLGFDLLHAWRNRKVLFTADVIWTHTEREHLAVALLQRFRLGRRRVPVLAQSVWLWDEWPGYGRLRRSLVAWLLRSHPVELVHSALNAAASREHVPGRLVLQVPFGTQGVGRAEAPPARADRPVVLALGNDRHRDWDLLAAVADALPDLDFVVASSSRRARAAPWGANVVVTPLVGAARLREAYARADAVVLPLGRNLHASGATTAIEAMTAGRPLVVSRAGGIDDYVDGLASMVGTGDVRGFVEATNAAVAGDAPGDGPAVVAARGLTQQDYVRRYALVTRALLGRGPWGPEISAFAPVEPGDGPRDA